MPGTGSPPSSSTHQPRNPSHGGAGQGTELHSVIGMDHRVIVLRPSMVTTSDEAVSNPLPVSATPQRPEPYRVPMRWHALFADMELQLADAESQELQAQVSELT